MAEREVRYCTTEDGVRIAYCVEGEGPTLVMCQHFIESFSLERVLPELGQFVRRLRPGRRIVQYDSRGTGLSTRDADDMSGDGRLLDIEAVVAAAGGEPVSLFAAGISGPMALRFALDHPDRLKKLLLVGVFAWPTEAFTPDWLRTMARLSRTNWPLAAQTFGDLSTRAADPEAGLRLGEAFRLSSSGAAVTGLLVTSPGKDIRSDLPRIITPTLIVHRRDDANFPFESGQRLAAAIPNAVFAPVEGVISYYPFGDQEAILQPILSFLRDERRAEARAKRRSRATAPGLRTVLFTDVVENTALLRRIGDEAWRTVMREHEEIVRAALKEHGGTEISTSGDGFFASFGSSVRALQCAVEMQRAFARRNETAEHPVEVRIGLNAGEPIEEGKDVLGTAVTMAARIMSQAGAGEILASDVVRQLVAGKGFLFADRGEFVAKGFEEPVRVYEVRWRA